MGAKIRLAGTVAGTLAGTVAGKVAGGVVGVVGGGLVALVLGLLAALYRSPDARWTVDDVAGSIFLTCIWIGVGIGFVIPFVGGLASIIGILKAEADRLKAEEDRQRDELASAQAHMESRKVQLSNLLSSSREDLRGLPTLVAAAEAHLDRAEREFAEGAFTPFWDQVEHATTKLANYHQQVSTIQRNAIQYQAEAANLSFLPGEVPTPFRSSDPSPHSRAANLSFLPGEVPPFTLPTRQLPDARPSTIRLASLVRKAQKNFQFDMIYHQRRTNQILVEGFGTLASAIFGLGDLISDSLGDLSSTLHISLDQILQTASTDAVAMLQTASADAAARRRFEDSSLEKQDEQTKMLDDIRRRRKPLL